MVDSNLLLNRLSLDALYGLANLYIAISTTIFALVFVALLIATFSAQADQTTPR